MSMRRPCPHHQTSSAPSRVMVPARTDDVDRETTYGDVDLGVALPANGIGRATPSSIRSPVVPSNGRLVQRR